MSKNLEELEVLLTKRKNLKEHIADLTLEIKRLNENIEELTESIYNKCPHEWINLPRECFDDIRTIKCKLCEEWQKYRG
tara:strand:+ start:119 stop:355 length:237 start_codon:yes stop_codon:yes gene_type:complete